MSAQEFSRIFKHLKGYFLNEINNHKNVKLVNFTYSQRRMQEFWAFCRIKKNKSLGGFHMELVLYIAAIIAAVAFFILCVGLAVTLFSLKKTLESLTTTLAGLEGQLEGITRETTTLLTKTNSLADDISDKSQKLNTVVHAVKGIGDSVNGLNTSVQKITSSISTGMHKNEDKIAQVVQWSNVAMGIADQWRSRKPINSKDVPIVDSVDVNQNK